MTLRARILAEIAAHGPIPFSRYMELCLYEPELGYYSRSTRQFGKAGDFYTSSDVHAVFGRLLARQFDEMWRALDSPPRFDIVELGPGRGLFARDVLDWSHQKFPALFDALHYRLVETSPTLRHHLAETLSDHLASGKASLGESAAEVSAESAAEVPAIFFANEFFDAFPVEILSSEGKLVLDGHNGRFLEQWVSPSDEELHFLDRYGVHPESGERIEVPLAAQTCMGRLAASLHRGFFLAIDYGYTRAEQLAGRHRGTLLTYRRHSTSADPYEAPGDQDITAHVNFTALAAAAQAAGMEPQKLVTQSQFLMGIGEPNQFVDAFEDCRLPQERAKVALQLKHLVTPSGMGETFQVMLCSRRVAQERVAHLSGLSFAHQA